MDNELTFDDEQEWLIWNGFYGVATTVTLGRVKSVEGGRIAWMDNPFEMVGPFSLDELENTGRIAFAACIILSPEKWQQDQAKLRREGEASRRAAQERLNARNARFNEHRHLGQHQNQQIDDRTHRESLNLPTDGQLKPAQIKTAYRRLAQKTHPDAGGSQEQFVRITEARDILLARA